MPYGITSANAGGAGGQVAPPVPPAFGRGNGYPAEYIPPAPQPQQFAPQPPQQRQAPQVGYGVVDYGQPPASYAQPQQPQQAPQQPGVPQRVLLDENHVLDGPGVPQELRGRTVGQAMRIYGTLADSYLRRAGGAPQPQQPQQPTPQPQQPYGQAPQPAYGQPAVPTPPRNQQGQYVQQGQPPRQYEGWGEPQQPQQPQPDVRQIIREELAPYTQNAAMTALENARRTIPDFAELESEILQQLDGMPQQVLAQPKAWERAADLVRGARMRQNFQRNGQPGGHAGGYAPQPQQPAVYAPAAGVSVPANSYGLPQHAFFTEGPTPPVMGQEYGLSAAEQSAAAAFGMSPDEYRAWKGGVAGGRR